jgi:hypothetical protein
MEDLESVIKCYQGAFDCTGAVPLERVKAAACCLSRLTDLHKTHEAIKLGREALKLLPIVNNRNLDRSDQQLVLSGFAGCSASSILKSFTSLYFRLSGIASTANLDFKKSESSSEQASSLVVSHLASRMAAGLAVV